MDFRAALGLMRTATTGRKGRMLTAVRGGLSVLVAGLALRPSPPELGTSHSGQAGLVERVQQLTKDVPSHRMAVVLVRSESPSRAVALLISSRRKSHAPREGIHRYDVTM